MAGNAPKLFEERYETALRMEKSPEQTRKWEQKVKYADCYRRTNTIAQFVFQLDDPVFTVL